MKIPNYKVGTSFVINCAKVKRRYCGDELDEFIYDSFGIDSKHAYFWARKPEEIVKVRCTIIEEDVLINNLIKSKEYDDNCVDYFGWIDFDSLEGDLTINMIYPNIKLYFVCFPYGPDLGRFWNSDSNDFSHKKGDRRGMTVRLKIEEI